MAGIKRRRLTGTRRAGLALAGIMAAGLAAVSSTALASTAAPAAGMSGMSMASGNGSHVGTTPGWYKGKTVTFKYSRNFSCRTLPASAASSKCEVGSNYTQTPAGAFDPLYVLVPLGFTPARSTLACPTAGKCIDHPSTIDLTAVLGKGAGNVLLPAHSHIVATANGGYPEWWDVMVVGVTSQTAWNKLVSAKSYMELKTLQRSSKSGVTGNLGTNLFLYFGVKSWS